MQTQTDFTQVQECPNFTQLEENVLQFWKENECYQIQKQKNNNMPNFVMYDGPPYVNKMPHYGHVAVNTIKDVVYRYANQTGHNVVNKIGWDSHGLSIESQVDKIFCVGSKKQHQEMGLKMFNEQCRKVAQKYSQQWEHILTRFGRLTDYKNAYKSHQISYMQSVWFAFKQIFQKGLISHQAKINPFSFGCQTALAQFQSRLYNKTVSSNLICVALTIKNDPSTKILVQDCRPWMLIFNIGLFVNPSLTYVKIKNKQTNQNWIISESRLQHLCKETKTQYEAIQKITGKQYIGIQYLPLVQLSLNLTQVQKGNIYKIYPAEFVNIQQGTGFYNCSPWFDQKSFDFVKQQKLLSQETLIKVPIDLQGKVTEVVKKYQNIYIEKINKTLIKDLKQGKKLIFDQNQYIIECFCIYSQRPLVSKVCNTWFLKSTQIKKEMLQNSQNVNWISKDIQKTRFQNWIEKSQDWCIARQRYWGTPIPLWISEDLKQIICVGSIQELEHLTGQKITDLHRQSIDHLTIPSKKEKGKLKRISEVFDCWFQSSCMPYAHVHYPFQINQLNFQKFFPADIVIQGADQLVCWFYTLNVISCALGKPSPFKNVLANGLLIIDDKKGMAMKLKNNPNPIQSVQQYGADAIRLYFITSPILQQANNLHFNQQMIRDVVKEIITPWYNTYKFLIQHILTYELIADKSFVFNQQIQVFETNIIDKWIQAKLQLVIEKVQNYMKNFQINLAIQQILQFLSKITKWYVKFNQQILKNEQFDKTDEMEVSLNVLFQVFLKLNILLSPYVPFLTESMYQNMKLVIRKDSSLYSLSIHHLRFPVISQPLKDQLLVESMNYAIEIIETGKKLISNLQQKKDMKALTVVDKNVQKFQLIQQLIPYIKRSLHVTSIKYSKQIDKYFIIQALPNLPALGPKLKGREDSRLVLTQIKNALQKMTQEEIQQYRIKQWIKLGKWTLQKGDIRLVQKKCKNTSTNQIFGGDSIKVILQLGQLQL